MQHVPTENKTTILSTKHAKVKCNQPGVCMRLADRQRREPKIEMRHNMANTQ